MSIPPLSSSLVHNPTSQPLSGFSDGVHTYIGEEPSRETPQSQPLDSFSHRSVAPNKSGVQGRGDASPATAMKRFDELSSSHRSTGSQESDRMNVSNDDLIDQHRAPDIVRNNEDPQDHSGPPEVMAHHSNDQYRQLVTQAVPNAVAMSRYISSCCPDVSEELPMTMRIDIFCRRFSVPHRVEEMMNAIAQNAVHVRNPDASPHYTILDYVSSSIVAYQFYGVEKTLTSSEPETATISNTPTSFSESRKLPDLLVANWTPDSFASGRLLEPYKATIVNHIKSVNSRRKTMISAPPGSGKTMLLPLFLFEALAFGSGYIILVEQTPHLATSVAHKLKEEVELKKKDPLAPYAPTLAVYDSPVTMTESNHDPSTPCIFVLHAEALMLALSKSNYSSVKPTLELEFIRAVIIDDVHLRNASTDIMVGFFRTVCEQADSSCHLVVTVPYLAVDDPLKTQNYKDFSILMLEDSRQQKPTITQLSIQSLQQPPLEPSIKPLKNATFGSDGAKVHTINLPEVLTAARTHVNVRTANDGRLRLAVAPTAGIGGNVQVEDGMTPKDLASQLTPEFLARYLKQRINTMDLRGVGILVYMWSAHSVERVVRALNSTGMPSGWEVLPLHENLAFDSLLAVQQRRKSTVVVATSMAESLVNAFNIRLVMDTGLVKKPWSAASSAADLDDLFFISPQQVQLRQASIFLQRLNGYYLRMFPEGPLTDTQRVQHMPEIESPNCNLRKWLFLSLGLPGATLPSLSSHDKRSLRKALQVQPNYASIPFKWMDAPSQSSLGAALSSLYDLRCLKASPSSPNHWAISESGEHIRPLGIDPQWAAFLMAAKYRSPLPLQNALVDITTTIYAIAQAPLSIFDLGSTDASAAERRAQQKKESSAFTSDLLFQHQVFSKWYAQGTIDHPATCTRNFGPEDCKHCREAYAEQHKLNQRTLDLVQRERSLVMLQMTGQATNKSDLPQIFHPSSERIIPLADSFPATFDQTPSAFDSIIGILPPGGIDPDSTLSTTTGESSLAALADLASPPSQESARPTSLTSFGDDQNDQENNKKHVDNILSKLFYEFFASHACMLYGSHLSSGVCSRMHQAIVHVVEYSALHKYKPSHAGFFFVSLRSASPNLIELCHPIEVNPKQAMAIENSMKPILRGPGFTEAQISLFALNLIPSLRTIPPPSMHVYNLPPKLSLDESQAVSLLVVRMQAYLQCLPTSQSYTSTLFPTLVKQPTSSYESNLANLTSAASMIRVFDCPRERVHWQQPSFPDQPFVPYPPSLILQACWEGDLDFLIFLKEVRNHELDWANAKKYACVGGHMALLSWLIASENKTSDQPQTSPLRKSKKARAQAEQESDFFNQEIVWSSESPPLLQYACLSGHVEFVKQVAAQHPPNGDDDEGLLEIAKYLILSDLFDVYVVLVAHWNRSAHLLDLLIEAAAVGRVTFLKELLANTAVLQKASFDQLFLLAVNSGCPYLLDCLNLTNMLPKHVTALVSAFSRHYQLVRWVIQRDAIFFVSLQRSYGSPIPLSYYAALNSDQDTLKLLSGGASPLFDSNQQLVVPGEPSDMVREDMRSRVAFALGTIAYPADVHTAWFDGFFTSGSGILPFMEMMDKVAPFRSRLSEALPSMAAYADLDVVTLYLPQIPFDESTFQCAMIAAVTHNRLEVLELLVRWWCARPSLPSGDLTGISNTSYEPSLSAASTDLATTVSSADHATCDPSTSAAPLSALVTFLVAIPLDLVLSLLENALYFGHLHIADWMWRAFLPKQAVDLGAALETIIGSAPDLPCHALLWLEHHGLSALDYLLSNVFEGPHRKPSAKLGPSLSASAFTTYWVPIHAGETTILAFRWILCSRWPYADRLMQEGRLGSLTLPGEMGPILLRFVQYIYTGLLPSSWSDYECSIVLQVSPLLQLDQAPAFALLLDRVRIRLLPAISKSSWHRTALRWKQFAPMEFSNAIPSILGFIRQSSAKTLKKRLAHIEKHDPEILSWLLIGLAQGNDEDAQATIATFVGTEARPYESVHHLVRTMRTPTRPEEYDNALEIQDDDLNKVLAVKDDGLELPKDLAKAKSLVEVSPSLHVLLHLNSDCGRIKHSEFVIYNPLRESFAWSIIYSSYTSSSELVLVKPRVGKTDLRTSSNNSSSSSLVKPEDNKEAHLGATNRGVLQPGDSQAFDVISLFWTTAPRSLLFVVQCRFSKYTVYVPIRVRISTSVSLKKSASKPQLILRSYDPTVLLTSPPHSTLKTMQTASTATLATSTIETTATAVQTVSTSPVHVRESAWLQLFKSKPLLALLHIVPITLPAHPTLQPHAYQDIFIADYKKNMVLMNSAKTATAVALQSSTSAARDGSDLPLLQYMTKASDGSFLRILDNARTVPATARAMLHIALKIAKTLLELNEKHLNHLAVCASNICIDGNEAKLMPFPTLCSDTPTFIEDVSEQPLLIMEGPDLKWTTREDVEYEYGSLGAVDVHQYGLLLWELAMGRARTSNHLEPFPEDIEASLPDYPKIARKYTDPQWREAKYRKLEKQEQARLLELRRATRAAGQASEHTPSDKSPSADGSIQAVLSADDSTQTQNKEDAPKIDDDTKDPLRDVEMPPLSPFELQKLMLKYIIRNFIKLYNYHLAKPKTANRAAAVNQKDKTSKSQPKHQGNPRHNAPSTKAPPKGQSVSSPGQIESPPSAAKKQAPARDTAAKPNKPPHHHPKKGSKAKAASSSTSKR